MKDQIKVKRKMKLIQTSLKTLEILLY